MKYEIRYMLNQEEHVDVVDSESAAGAAEQVRQQHSQQETDDFELIQVTLLDEAESESTDA